MAAMRLDPPLDRFTFDEKELRQFVRSFAERVTPPGFSARERAKAVKALDTQDAEIDRAERAYQQAFKFVQEAHKQSEAAEKTDDDAVKKIIYGKQYSH